MEKGKEKTNLVTRQCTATKCSRRKFLSLLPIASRQVSVNNGIPIIKQWTECVSVCGKLSIFVIAGNGSMISIQ